MNRSVSSRKEQFYIQSAWWVFLCFFFLLLLLRVKKKKQGVVLPQREMTSCPRVREKCRTNLSRHVKLYKIHGNGFLFF